MMRTSVAVARDGAATYIGGGVPITWATGDRVQLGVWYIEA